MWLNLHSLCIPKMVNLQHTVLWLHARYAVYNVDYRKFARTCFWLYSGVDDPRLQQFMNEDQNLLIREDQYMLPIKNTVMRILKLSKNQAMPKNDILKIIKYAHKSVNLTPACLSRVISTMEKDGLVKIVSISEPPSSNKNFVNPNCIIVQLSDKPIRPERSNLHTTGKPSGILCDVPLANQIVRLIIDSKEEGITSVAIASSLNGVKDRVIEYFLHRLAKCADIPHFPYVIHRTSVHIGKERIYLYHAKKKDAGTHVESPSGVIKDVRPNKKLKRYHSSEITLTTMNRRKMFLEIVRQKKYIDRFQLHTILQKNVNSANNIHCTIDRKTIDRDAKSLCEKNLINSYVAAVTNASGSPLIKFIYLLPDVDINGDEFKSFIESLRVKPLPHSRNGFRPVIPVVKDLSFDRFSNWVNTKGLIDNRHTPALMNFETPGTPCCGSDDIKVNTKQVYSFISGKMLRAKYLHLLLLENLLFSENTHEDKPIMFNSNKILEFMNAKDIVRFVQCRSQPTLKHLLSRLLEDGEHAPKNSRRALMDKVMQMVDLKVKAVVQKLLPILESLQLIEIIETKDEKTINSNYKIVTEIPFMNLLASKRIVIEKMKISSIADAEYYWHRLQLSCLYGRDYIKDRLVLNRNLISSSISGNTDNSPEWPHYPGYLFSSSGDILCAVWRRSHWVSRDHSSKSNTAPAASKPTPVDSNGTSSDHKTTPACEPRHLSKNLTSYNSAFPASIPSDRVHTDNYLASSIPEKIFPFKKTPSSDTLVGLPKRCNEDIVYAIAILSSSPKRMDTSQKINLLAELLRDKYHPSNEDYTRIKERLSDLSDLNPELPECISQLMELYVDIKSNSDNAGVPDARSFLDVYDFTTLDKEIAVLRSAHEGCVGAEESKKHDVDLESMESDSSHGSEGCTVAGVDISAQRESHQHNMEHACIPRTTPGILMALMFSKSFSVNLEKSDIHDDAELEGSSDTSAHEDLYFCLQNIIKIIALSPHECYDPLKAFILLAAHPKPLVDATIDYMWRRKTVTKLKRTDTKNNTPVKGISLSENFVIGISGVSEGPVFDRARELYKKQVHTWINKKNGIGDGRSVLTPLHMSPGGLPLLLNELVTSQIKLETSFPQYILDNIKKDSSDSLDCIGFELYEELQDEFGNYLEISKGSSAFGGEQNAAGLHFGTQDQMALDIPSESKLHAEVALDVDTAAHQKNTRGRASLELRKFYSESFNEQHTHYAQRSNNLFPSVADAINIVAPQGKQRKLLSAIVSALDDTGLAGMTETELYYRMLEEHFDTDACKNISRLIGLSQRALVGKLARPLISAVGLSRVYYVSCNHSLKKHLRIPPEDLWIDILKSVDSTDPKIAENSFYSQLLNHNSCIDIEGTKMRLAPARIWYNLHGKLVHSIWISSCRAVASNIAKYPGISESKLYSIMSYMLTRVEIREMLNFLIDAKACRTRCFTKLASPSSITDAINMSTKPYLFTECDPVETIPGKITYLWTEPTWLTLFSALEQHTNGIA